jgi:hypothetical protein
MYYKENNTPTVLLPEMDTMRMIRERDGREEGQRTKGWNG